MTQAPTRPIVMGRPTVVHEPAPVPPGRITAERYTSPAYLQREVEDLWPRTWLFACLERDVSLPGQYAVLNIGRESIIVSCRDDGGLAAFYNVCQHRGAKLMANPLSRVKAFVCPYHGWTYDRSGALVHVPDIERFSQGLDCEANSLAPVKVEAWSGLVFVHMDLNAPPLREYLAGVAEAVDPYRIQDMSLIGDQTVHLDCNWKAVFDNFGELYHVEHIHPQHAMLFDCPTAQIDLFGNGHTGVLIDGHIVNTRLPIPEQPNFYMEHQLKMYGVDPATYVGRVLDVRKDMQKVRRQVAPRLGYDYDLLSDERLSDIEQYNLFPNTMITVTPDTALVMRARPHPTDPNQCWWDKFTFRMQPDPAVAERAGVAFEPYPGTQFDDSERPEHDEFDQEDVIAGRKTMTITVDQDVHYIRDVQAGMHSRGFKGQQLCDDEVRIQHYHDWYDHVLGLR